MVGPPTNLPHADDESPSMRRIREGHRLDAFERPSPLASVVADPIFRTSQQGWIWVSESHKGSRFDLFVGSLV